MISILFLLFFNIFYFFRNDSFIDLEKNVRPYRYEQIINFYKLKISLLDDQKLLLMFNSLKYYDFSDSDCALIDYNDFIIIYLEYCVLYTYYYSYINIIDKIIPFVAIENKNNIDKVLINYSKKIDNFYENIYIDKIKLYIEYKKNNKNYDGIIDSAYIFLLAFAHNFLSY